MNWGSYGKNIYYNPEKCGLAIVAQIEREDLSYEYDITLLLKRGEKFYLASDSGCSCPTPFEDFRSLADLTPLVREADAHGFLSQYPTAQRQAFLRKVREVLKVGEREGS